MLWQLYEPCAKDRVVVTDRVNEDRVVVTDRVNEDRVVVTDASIRYNNMMNTVLGVSIDIVNEDRV